MGESSLLGPWLALGGFLAGYTGLTREAYALDLRQYASWCHQRRLRLFAARRADSECFARDMEARGRARATITRRLCTLPGSTNTPLGRRLMSTGCCTLLLYSAPETRRRVRKLGSDVGDTGIEPVTSSV